MNSNLYRALGPPNHNLCFVILAKVLNANQIIIQLIGEGEEKLLKHMAKTIKVKKFSGELVDFDESKLVLSLRAAKADQALANKIIKDIRSSLYDGITTKKIYQKAFQLLKRKQRPSASRYKLKRAIMELGPSGFPFERYIGHIFNHDGYDTEVGIIMQGNCVSHEVDVVAKKENRCYIIECKYHNSQGKTNDVKIPLYIHSRFNDVRRKLKASEPKSNVDYTCWIFTNTRFTSDAIDYAKCSGMQLISWDYPENKSLKYRINKSGLFPITSLTSITKREKSLLLDEGIVLCKEISENSALLTKFGISKARIKNVLGDIKELCDNHKNGIVE